MKKGLVVNVDFTGYQSYTTSSLYGSRECTMTILVYMDDIDLPTSEVVILSKEEYQDLTKGMIL